MMRAILIACLLCLASASAQAQFSLDINRLIDTAKSLSQASTEIDEQGEIEIGRDVAARLLGAAPLYPSPSTQRYVNEVGRWLASQTERPNLPWRFAVLDAPQVNAFAAPGGFIFVTRGLVARMHTEAELAGDPGPYFAGLRELIFRDVEDFYTVPGDLNIDLCDLGRVVRGEGSPLQTAVENAVICNFTSGRGNPRASGLAVHFVPLGDSGLILPHDDAYFRNRTAGYALEFTAVSRWCPDEQLETGFLYKLFYAP